MSTEFELALTKLMSDPAFRRELAERPDAVLSNYDLTDQERSTLKSVNSTAEQALQKRESPQEEASWFKPTSFRETGASVLSIFLIALLLLAAWVTFAQINSPPIVVQVGDTVQVVDPFERAQGLLNIFFPLFGAVVTFWLGVTVEGRRADRNEEEAEQAKEEKQQEVIKKEAAEQEAMTTREAALEVMNDVEQFLDGIDDEEDTRESLVLGEGGGSSGPDIDLLALQEMKNKLKESRRRLYR